MWRNSSLGRPGSQGKRAVVQKLGGQLLGPITFAVRCRPQVMCQLRHRFERVALRESDDVFRVWRAKMPLNRIVEPGQPQYLQRLPAVTDVHVTIKSPVQQYITRCRRHAAGKARLREGTRQHNRRVPSQVAMSRAKGAAGEALDPRPD